MKNTIKSQAALEFLVTYGWAILGVLVVIGALAYFGVFNATKYVNDVCEFGEQMNCEDFIIYRNSSVAFQLRNNFGVPIDITGVRVRSEYGYSVCDPNLAVAPDWENVMPGLIFDVKCNITNTNANLTPGSKVRFTAVIEFRKNSGGVPGQNPRHNQTGSIFASVSH
jgi:hypothetical protein